MSMLSIRDLSVIETPPTNRFPVQTYVMEQNFALVREAVQGKCLWASILLIMVKIWRKVDEIKQLVPEARVGFANGQMGESALESDFKFP